MGSLPKDPRCTTPLAPGYPVEGGEVGSGGQYIQQLPVAHTGPVTHEAVAASAGHVCREGSAVSEWVGRERQKCVGLGGGRTSHAEAVGVPALREVLPGAQADHAHLAVPTVCCGEDDGVGSRAVGQPAHKAEVEAQLQRQKRRLRPKAQLKKAPTGLAPDSQAPHTCWAAES